MRVGITFNGDALSCMAVEVKRAAPDVGASIGWVDLMLLRTAKGGLDIFGASRVHGGSLSPGTQAKAEELLAMIEADVEAMVSSSKGVTVSQTEDSDTAGMFDSEEV